MEDAAPATLLFARNSDHPRRGRFQFEEFRFPRQPPRKSAGSGHAHDTVTGNDKRQPIGGARLADCPARARIAECGSDPTVGERFSRWNRPQFRPDPPVERRRRIDGKSVPFEFRNHPGEIAGGEPCGDPFWKMDGVKVSAPVQFDRYFERTGAELTALELLPGGPLPRSALRLPRFTHPGESDFHE
jgi:hypothetical protein